MTLLGVPSRMPVVRMMYLMPAALYDRTDVSDHPLLVVGLDAVARRALCAPRTSSEWARGHRFVVHKRSPDWPLDRLGWWQLDRIHQVPYVTFGQSEVRVLGELDEATWRHVESKLGR